MVGGDPRNQLLNKHRLSHARTAEQADFSAFGVRGKQVDDFDPRFENFRDGALLGERGGLAVDGHGGGRYGALAVHGLAEGIQNSARYLVAHGYAYARARRFHLQPAREAVRRLEGDTAAYSVGKVGQYLEIHRFFPVEDEQKLVLVGKVIVEFYIDHRADDLYDLSRMCFDHKNTPPYV